MAELVFHHIAIAAKDPLRIERFYTKYFGFTRSRVLPIGGGEQIVFIRNGSAYMEIFQAKEARPYPAPEKDGPWWEDWRHIAFKVDSVDEKLKEMGGDAKITLGPFEFDAFIPGWKTVWIADPEGNIIEISQGYTDDPNPPALEQ